ncbi:MAG TPA: hypothetical protein VMW50_12730 [Dehalococcoidia bacterium]|nr:hypothetical protein [Dehalococcoidia bacterium]
MLRACPKCGETLIELEEWSCGDDPTPAYRYRCANLDAWDAWWDTPEEAEADWNKTPNTDFNLTQPAALQVKSMLG